MDIENPLAFCLMILSGIIGGSLLFGFFMQFHEAHVEWRSYQMFKEDLKSGNKVTAILKWYFLSNFLVCWTILKESKSFWFVVPLGLTFCGISYALFHYLFK